MRRSSTMVVLITLRAVPTGAAAALVLAIVLAMVMAVLIRPPAARAQVPATQLTAPRGPMVALMGKRLFGPQGEELGRLVDLVAGVDGRPMAVVVDVGGFMGLGSRRVALAWEVLRFRVEPDMVRMWTELAPEVGTAAPEYRPGDPDTILSAPAAR